MAIQIQLRKGTATEHNTFTGANGEVTVDTTNKTLRVHDGVTAGGTPLLNASQLVDSTTTVKGVTRFATNTEVINKSNVTAAVTPKNVADMFSQQLSSEGNCVLPNGLVLKWGLATEYITKTFEDPFPNACVGLSVTLIGSANDSSGAVTQARIIDKSSFIFTAGVNNGNIAYWFAIGY